MTANGGNWEAPGTPAGSAGWEGAAGQGGPTAEAADRLVILAVVLVGAFMIPAGLAGFTAASVHW
jgi:hypothetical protein